LLRQYHQASKNTGAAASDGKAPDHGTDADHHDSSHASMQNPPCSNAATANPSETQRITAARLETIGSRVLVKKPNSDS